MNTPGSLLKQARLERNMTLQQLSAVTRIPRVSLGHLENDAFEELPAEVFVRGFIRNVSRELNLDAKRVINAYEGLTGQQHSSPRVVKAELVEDKPVKESSPVSLSAMAAPRLIEALPTARFSAPSWERVVDFIGSAKPSYVIGTLVLLLGVALTISVMANGMGPRPSLSLDTAATSQQATWDVKADGSKAPWIVKGQTNNLAGATTIDLSRPSKTRKADR